jgi:hypothetical protein
VHGSGQVGFGSKTPMVIPWKWFVTASRFAGSKARWWIRNLLPITGSIDLEALVNIQPHWVASFITTSFHWVAHNYVGRPLVFSDP